MSDDLPPGVRGPIPNPTVEAKKDINLGIVEQYPIVEYKSKLNPTPYVFQLFYYTMHKPAMMLKNFIESMRSPVKRRYYHAKYRRVPEIWECKTKDYICIYEAEIQYKRDKMVESAILEILEQKRDHCVNTYPISAEETCKKDIEEFQDVRKNWTVKYGDLGNFQNARNTLTKQKNRFIEKRYKERIGMSYNEDWLIPDIK